MYKAIQKYFDKWSLPITGYSSDINQSSHGRAFVAGWVAAMDYMKKEKSPKQV